MLGFGFNTGIFERAVQDPCSHDCDFEDSTINNIRKVKTVPCNMDGYGYSKRTNSCAYIHQLSNCNNFSPLSPCDDSCSIARTRTRTASIGTSMSRNNSLSTVSIPSHVYGLEKYVSSKLDALSSFSLNCCHTGFSVNSIRDNYDVNGDDSESTDDESTDSTETAEEHAPIHHHNNFEYKLVDEESLARSFIKSSLASSFA